MRILFLLYSQLDSSDSSSAKARSRFPWADVLLNEIVKLKSVTISLAMPAKDSGFQKREEEGITVYSLPNPEVRSIFGKINNRIKHNIENTKINQYVMQVVSDFQPDIIQIFGSENPFGLIIANLKIPVIIHIQGYLMVWKGKWFTSISKWDQLRYGSIKELLLMTGSYSEYFNFRNRAEREEIILKQCRYFIGRTLFDKQIAYMLSPDSTYFHCEEFIRRKFFEIQWNFPVQKEITCVSILKGTSYKGIDLLIEASVILKKYFRLKCNFKICGVTEKDEVIQIIRKKYKEEFGHLNIEFLGRLSADDLVKQLCTSNLYLHPSYIENSPNSVCEAMALGMPVIATNVGGINSLITDGVDGVLVQEGEPYSFSAAIINLINNYEYAKLLGTNARKRSLVRHDPGLIMNQLVNIYETILIEYDQK